MILVKLLSRLLPVALALCIGACAGQGLPGGAPMPAPAIEPAAFGAAQALPTAPKRSMRLCMAGARGAAAFYAEAVPLGISDCVAVYYTLGSNNPLPYLKYNELTDVILVLKTGDIHGEGYLGKVAAGRYDDELRRIGLAIREAGRPVEVRLWNEVNGDWYKHGTYYPGNRLEDFVPAWNRAIAIIIDAAGPEFVANTDLNLNRASAGGRAQSDFASYFAGITRPGSTAASTYNRCGLSPSHAEQKSFEQEFGPAYRAIEALYGGPINVAEVSTTDLCGTDKLTWFREMLESIERDFPKVDTIIFFFETVPTGAATNNRPIVWGIANEDWAGFRKLIDDFRARNGIPTPEPVREIATFGASGMEPGNVQWPWTVSMSLTSSHFDRDNAELNDESGNPYGRRGIQFYTRVSQGARYGVKGFTGRDSVGVDLYATGALSSNENRYWDNAASVGVRLPYNFGKPPFAEWGNMSIFIGAEHIRYLGNEPKDVGNGDERVYFGAAVTFGGNWKTGSNP